MKRAKTQNSGNRLFETEIMDGKPQNGGFFQKAAF